MTKTKQKVQWQENSPVAPMLVSEVKNYLSVHTDYRLPTRNELFTAFESKVPGFFVYGFYCTTFPEMEATYGKKALKTTKFLVRLIKKESTLA